MVNSYPKALHFAYAEKWENIYIKINIYILYCIGIPINLFNLLKITICLCFYKQIFYTYNQL